MAFVVVNAIEHDSINITPVSDTFSAFKWGIGFTIYCLCGTYSIIKLFMVLVNYRGSMYHDNK